MKPAGFQDGVRKDVGRRIRAAIAKLNDRVVDVEIDITRARATKDDDAADALRREAARLEGHARMLRFTFAWFAVHGSLHLCPEDEEALAAAERPRRAARPKPEKTKPAPAMSGTEVRRVTYDPRASLAAIKPADVPHARRLLSQLNDGPTGMPRPGHQLLLGMGDRRDG